MAGRQAAGSRSVVDLAVDAAAEAGPLQLWRHGVGLGGVSSEPLPAAVVAAARALRPKLVRIFIQQFFDVYPDHGRFDWGRLDPYMDALADTGARVVAAVCIKPRPLFARVDHAVWRPSDVGEWQEVLRALVRRYSVDRELVTHWEIGNETDIGEAGGSPYLIQDGADYAAFYEMSVRAVREVDPRLKVGGPAACWVTNEPLPTFVDHCRRTGTPLDFVSWHRYDDDWRRHAEGVRLGRELLTGFHTAPELMVTEWSKSFEQVSLADQAGEPRRAALAAATVLAMRAAGLDWSFYYHLWDQACDPAEFEPFFSPEGVAGMYRHWNEVPHRFGLFGERGEVRPQYFAFQLLGMLGATRLEHRGGSPDLQVLAGRDGQRVSTLLVNTTVDPGEATDRIVTVRLTGLAPGPRTLTVYRIDNARRWDCRTLRQSPLEERRVVTTSTFEHQLLLPADTVALASLSGPNGPAAR